MPAEEAPTGSTTARMPHTAVTTVPGTPAEPAPGEPSKGTQSPPADEPAAPLVTGAKRFFGSLAPSPQRRSSVMQLAAAAALLIVSVVVAVAGIQQITGRQAATEAELYSTTEQATEMATTPAPEVGGTDSRDEAPSAVQTQAPAMIVVSGIVYRAIGPATDVDIEDLTTGGSTQSSFGAGGAAKVRDVLVSKDRDKSGFVYVKDDSDELQSFERVTRQYRSKDYVLSSGWVLMYGEWPTVPEDVRVPSTPNGLPEYVSAGEDDSGVEIFRPTAGSAAEGFMVAPGTPVDDPAAGNPGWTWWVPAP